MMHIDKLAKITEGDYKGFPVMFRAVLEHRLMTCDQVRTVLINLARSSVAEYSAEMNAYIEKIKASFSDDKQAEIVNEEALDPVEDDDLSEKPDPRTVDHDEAGKA